MTKQRISSFKVSRLLITLAYAYFAVQFLYAVHLNKGFTATWLSPLVVYMGYRLWVFITNRKKFIEDTDVTEATV